MMIMIIIIIIIIIRLEGKRTWEHLVNGDGADSDLD